MAKEFSDLSIREKMEIIAKEMIESNLYLKEALSEFEKIFIEIALKVHKGNRCRASKTLGIHRNTLAGKINSLKIKNNKK
ncbi:MAG: helix-turn-helix domain-containing protein [Candidatus Aminicenantia bacterium]